ncbi:PQQ-dependent sugar dehydrogenase [Algoriphagus mannitolivorans]|uniref:PQQ-dependent sugar dehydrogenase n=1 Tax=Algoriphagus mannitolivorans TaxID=226504 RepID=UPI00042377BB|nr:PQQ-dependent sugar dehydrogenase [Algoriphagus mannitolivorans]
MISRLLTILLFGGVFLACSSKESEKFGEDISTAQDQILKGKAIFEQECSTCHNFNANAIGPNLSGLTRQVESSWIRDFIKNPQAKLEAQDARALELLAKYKSVMPSFAHLGDEKIGSLLSYLHTFEMVIPDTDADAVVNLIEPAIQDSGIRLELEFVAQLPASDTVPPMAKMTKMEPEAVSKRLFINDQRIGLYEMIEGKPVLYMNLLQLRPDLVSKPGWATGLGSFAFHPEFVNNGLFYTAHTEPGGTKPSDVGYTDSLQVFMQWVLTEWKATNPAAKTFEGIGRELLRVDNPSQAHGMQELTFNPNAKKGDEDYGLLYIGYGDGASAERGFPNIAHNQARQLYTGILRIDPAGKNSMNGQYGIPPSNPFAKQEGKAGEVYAYGFRNPNRIFWDQEGRMYATDIGQHTIEELNLVQPGKFYGWPIREGTFVINPYGSFRKVFPLPEDDHKLGITYPLIQMEHDELAAIFAGYIMPYGPLKGKFLFGDILSGRLFFADLNQKPSPEVKSLKVIFEGKEMTMEELVGGRVDLKFGIDAEKRVYIMSKNQGKIYRIK